MLGAVRQADRVPDAELLQGRLEPADGGAKPRMPDRSRWVWALTRPGRMAASPKSRSAARPPAGSTATTRPSANVSRPRSSGGPATGNSQRAVTVNMAGLPKVRSSLGGTASVAAGRITSFRGVTKRDILGHLAGLRPRAHALLHPGLAPWVLGRGRANNIFSGSDIFRHF